MSAVGLPLSASCKSYLTLLVGRFFTVLRLALPRTSIRDITYNGAVIPKGTVFFLNAWACNMGTLPTPEIISP
jgi:3-hydroxyphenylacetate 6-hydroxylase